MDFSELRDLLDFLENQGVDEQTLRHVFERYCPKDDPDAVGQSPANGQPAQQEALVPKANSH
jgi:hypothetical protein